MHDRTFSNSLDRYTVQASSTQHPSTDIKKCLQILPDIFWGTKSPTIESHQSQYQGKHFIIQNANVRFIQSSWENSLSLRWPKISLAYLVQFHCPPHHSRNVADAVSSLSALFKCCFCITRGGLIKAPLTVSTPSQPVFHSWCCHSPWQSLSVVASRCFSVSLCDTWVVLLSCLNLICKPTSPNPAPHLEEVHSFLFVVYPPWELVTVKGSHISEELFRHLDSVSLLNNFEESRS